MRRTHAGYLETAELVLYSDFFEGTRKHSKVEYSTPSLTIDDVNRL